MSQQTLQVLFSSLGFRHIGISLLIGVSTNSGTKEELEALRKTHLVVGSS